MIKNVCGAKLGGGADRSATTTGTGNVPLAQIVPPRGESARNQYGKGRPSAHAPAGSAKRRGDLLHAAPATNLNGLYVQ